MVGGEKVVLVKTRDAEDSPFDHVRGVATVKMGTDEIMALTRGDD